MRVSVLVILTSLILSDIQPAPVHIAQDLSPGSACNSAREQGCEAEPEFIPPANKYYTHAAGKYTPYGHELLGLLQALADQGKVDGDGLSRALASYYEGQAAAGHYLNKSSKALKENVGAGKTFPETGLAADAQANAYVKAPAVVALLFGSPGLTAGLTTAVSVQQSDEAAVSAGVAAGLVLERVVMGQSIEAALSWAVSEASGLAPTTREQLALAVSQRGEPFTPTAKALGLSCGLPAAMQCAMLSSLQAGSYAEGVRANIEAGGDNASRNVLVGALLAAQHGLESIPEAWKSQTKHYAEAEKLVDQLLARRA